MLSRIAALVIGLVVAPALIAAPTLASEDVVVSQETRTRQPGKRQATVQHVALVKNTAPHAIRGLRVTVELHDSFGKVLWARTVTPGPSSLKPGEEASLSVTTPYLEAYKKTVYRFEYRPDTARH